MNETNPNSRYIFHNAAQFTFEKCKEEDFLSKQSRIIERDSTRIWVIIDGAEAF